MCGPVVPTEGETYRADGRRVLSTNQFTDEWTHIFTVSDGLNTPEAEAERLAALLNAKATAPASEGEHAPAEWCGRPARPHLTGWHLVFDADGQASAVKWWPTEGCYTTTAQFGGLLTTPEQFREWRFSYGGQVIDHSRYMEGRQA